MAGLHAEPWNSAAIILSHTPYPDGDLLPFAALACRVGSQALALETTTPGPEAPYRWKDGITLLIAVLGAVLGILNYWNTISMRRGRVLVHPEHAIPVGGGGGEP